MPRHSDEETTIVAEISRPVLLRVGHEVSQVLLKTLIVESLESSSIVEVLSSRVGDVRMLSQDVSLEGIGPPVASLGSLSGDIGDCVSNGALGLGHGDDIVELEVLSFFRKP